MTTLETIHSSFEKELAHLVCRKVKHQEYCQDIIQEVYLKILLNQSKIEQANNVSAYLTRLATNTVMDFYRRKTKSAISSGSIADLPAGTEEAPEKNVQLADCCLRSFIDSLPEIYQKALVMVELENMKIKDYAALSNISLTNAKTRVQRAKKLLKKVILECCRYEFDAYGNITACVRNQRNPCCK